MKPGQEDYLLEDCPLVDFAGDKADNTLDYQEIFHGSPIPSLVMESWNGEIVLVDFNRAAAECLDTVTKGCLNRPIHEIFRGNTGLVGWLESCLSGGGRTMKTRSYEQSKNGAHPTLKFVLAYLGAGRCVVHLENIHRQRQVEADLTASKERLELAIYATDSGLWDWYIPSGTVIFGEQWAAILGYTIDEIEPHISTWHRLLHPDDSARVMACLERHLAGEQPRYESEHRLMGKDGQWVWVLDVGKVVEWDADNAPVRMTGTKVDISKRKKMEKELEQLNLELEKRIEIRTRKLKQSEQLLIKSQAHLEEKSKNLQETNNALKILLKKSAENKKEIEENILANIKELVLPYLQKIEEKNLDETQQVYLEIVRSNLDEITSHFSRQLIRLHLNLSPAEMSVAKLIKQGKSTKEIADLLFLSSKTIETQRRSIRRKLGLNGQKINLKTYLDDLIH